MQTDHALSDPDFAPRCIETEELGSQLDDASCKEVASILVVDDQAVNLRLAEAFLLDDGYQHIKLCDTPEDVPRLVRLHRPDVILLDVMMPRISGLELLRTLRTEPATRHIPVIVLTALTDQQTKSQALQLGATDFLTKPIDVLELLPRVRNALVLRQHHRYLEKQAQLLEQLVRRKTAELTLTQLRVIHCLARASEYRDNETGRHAVRVGRYARIIAEQLGLEARWCEHLMLAAMLHDVGKIGISDSILLKPGRLEAHERQLMQQHCEIGLAIIAPDWQDDLLQLLPIDDLGMCDSPLLDLASRVAATHHERWDGTGYPCGLKAEQIPLEGRITAVADVFDALGSARPYKEALSVERCRDMIVEGVGTHFDPKVVEAFLARFQEILRVAEQLRD